MSLVQTAARRSRSSLSRLPPVISVTPEMLAAGRSAFFKERDTLDDLYECFEVDIDHFIVAIYRAMQAIC